MLIKVPGAECELWKLLSLKDPWCLSLHSVSRSSAATGCFTELSLFLQPACKSWMTLVQWVSKDFCAACFVSQAGKLSLSGGRFLPCHVWVSVRGHPGLAEPESRRNVCPGVERGNGMQSKAGKKSPRAALCFSRPGLKRTGAKLCIESSNL